jgi:predicted metalloprotease with PDZ domain
MPRGLPAIEHEGLEHPSDFRAIYWGGAIACLMADVAARQRSHDALGLEDGFRAVLAAGGNAAQVWSLTQVESVIDATLGAPIVREIAEKHANRAEPIDLPVLLERLGVHSAPTGITLDDRAELAHVRRAITFGARH